MFSKNMAKQVPKYDDFRVFVNQVEEVTGLFVNFKAEVEGKFKKIAEKERKESK